MTDMNEQELQKLLEEKKRELDEARRVRGLDNKRRAMKHAANDEHRKQETARQLAATQEIARATRLSKSLSVAYQPTSVYSLSASGVVRSGMTFRNDAEEYAHGSAWNVKTVGVSLEEFVNKYSSLGFNVVEHEKPLKINYEKPVRGSREQEEAGLDELQLRARVVELKLAGRSYKKIAEELGWGDDIDAARRVAKVMREAMKS